jgi:serine/threonine protein kinase
LVNQQATWVGSRFGDWTIDELLGGGSFSRVYAGTYRDGRTRTAFKVARPADALGGSDADTGCLPTKAVLQMTGAIAELHPDTDDLISRQSEKLRKIKTKGMPEVEHSESHSGMTWYRMPLLEGQTLRKMIAGKQAVSVDIVLELLAKLNRLSSDKEFGYHGDIKPENVMVTKSGTVLLDPGHFGPLRNSQGTIEQTAVTTPAYYPLLLPDDVLAIGLMLWEIAAGAQPLRTPTYLSQLDKSRAHPELLSMVKAQEMAGQAYFSPIASLRPLSETFPNMPTDYDRFLLKCLRLELRNDLLAPAEGFRSFSAMSGALLQLQSKGLRAMQIC